MEICLGFPLNCSRSGSPVSDGHGDLLAKSLLEHLVSFVGAPACTVFTIDLKYLVTEPQTNQGGWRICLD